jgi:hypothetical protein
MSESSSGAMPLARHGWEAHLTAASIDFVHEAELALFDLADPVKLVKLKEEIEKVRSGEKILTVRVDDIDAYVENL